MRKKHHILYSICTLGFLIGIHNGYIALWKDGTPNPVQVFPYRAALLPLADQQKLAQGVQISNQEQLMRILEDYLS